MAERQTSVEELRERLTATLADWGTELAEVLRELESQRKELADLRRLQVDAKAVDELKKQLQGQTTLIESLTEEAGEADRLRRESGGKDTEIERLQAELASKQDLIRALRRDAETVDRVKGESKSKDKELSTLKKEKTRLDRELAELRDELDRLQEIEAASADTSELEAMRAELDARKTLIKSLRADAERAVSFENQLEEKREVIGQLEASINRNADTIDELKRTADVWKKKYLRLRGSEATATSAEVPALTGTDLHALERASNDFTPERTTAIDMRDALIKARHAATRTHEED